MPPADFSQEKNDEEAKAYAEEVGYHIIDIKTSIGKQVLYRLSKHTHTHCSGPYSPFLPVCFI